MGDQKRSDAVNTAPQGLASEFGILRAQVPSGDAIKNTAAQEFKGLDARRIRPKILGLVEALGRRHHENDAIMLRILKAKVDVGHKAALQAFQRIAGLFVNLGQVMDQAGKSFVAKLLEQFGFILEIEVDGGGGVFNLVGNAAHGDTLETFLDEELAGGIEDFLAQEAFLAGLAFFNAHGITPHSNLTMLR